jgi:hypothetical protein
MDTARFDRLISTFAEVSTRRGAVRVLAAIGLTGLTVLRPDETGAKQKGRRKKKNKHRGDATKGLRQSCTPGQTSCRAGLRCDEPTTRHTCSSTVDGIDNWCCVPPGGSCTECDCCGDYYCAFDDNNNPTCVPNPEG